MTKGEILAMEPGRELDYLVAKHVMGWDFGLSREGWRPPKELSPRYKIYEQFKPSTDIAATWEVVDKMGDDFWELTLDTGSKDTRSQAMFWTTLPADNQHCSVAESVPEAICKGALLAKLFGRETIENQKKASGEK